MPTRSASATYQPIQRSEESPDDVDTKDLAWILHDTALLNSGFPVSDAKTFSARMYRMLKNGLALDSLDLVPEIEVPEEEETEEEDAEEEDTEEAAVEDSSDEKEEM